MFRTFPVNKVIEDKSGVGWHHSRAVIATEHENVLFNLVSSSHVLMKRTSAGISPIKSESLFRAVRINFNWAEARLSGRLRLRLRLRLGLRLRLRLNDDRRSIGRHMTFTLTVDDDRLIVNGRFEVIRGLVLTKLSISEGNTVAIVKALVVCLPVLVEHLVGHLADISASFSSASDRASASECVCIDVLTFDS